MATPNITETMTEKPLVPVSQTTARTGETITVSRHESLQRPLSQNSGRQSSTHILDSHSGSVAFDDLQQTDFEILDTDSDADDDASSFTDISAFFAEMRQRGAVRNPDGQSERYFHDRYGLQPEQMWKLSIDRDRWGEGESAFDHGDPGYTKAVANAYDMVLEKGLNRDTMWTAETLEQIHDEAVRGIPSTSSGVKDTGYRDGFTSYGMFEMSTERPYVSKEGLKELIQRPETMVIDTNGATLEMFHPTYMYHRSMASGGKVLHTGGKSPQYLAGIRSKDSDGNPTHVRYYSMLSDAGHAKQKDNQLFQSFYEKMSDRALTADDKLTEIAKLTKEVELRHRFSDANGRTSVIMMNSLLEKYGFTPTVLSNPNDIDGLSTEELVADIRKGFITFRSLCSTE